jgi:hypothetical protein
MKLYASVTSERATKGQGGEYVDIVIFDSERKPLMKVSVKQNDRGYEYDETFYSTRLEKTKECNGKHKNVQAILDCTACRNHPLLELETKGEKEKSKVCDYHGVLNCSRCNPHTKS